MNLVKKRNWGAVGCGGTLVVGPSPLTPLSTLSPILSTLSILSVLWLSIRLLSYLSLYSVLFLLSLLSTILSILYSALTEFFLVSAGLWFGGMGIDVLFKRPF